VDLGKIAKSVRRRIFEFKTRTGKGHLASCLSLVDLLVSMYYDEETNFNHKEDIVIYSKGHGSPAVYPILADLGYIENDELEKYCQPEGKLRLHADQSIPGCHFVGGSLGNGIGYAAGLAYGTGKNVYAILGDAELYEGSVWETLIFVAHHKINNLYMFVDRNKMGILGKTEELLKLEPLKEKFESFGLEVHEVDGHDFDELRKVLSIKSDNPKMIIADTIKGKGVSYMEDVWQYHTIIPKEKDLLETAMEELN
tara:strand:- start:6560 stop:7321 length:762 start_codon:yes stop_codon:yes gene_type:complete